MDKYNYSINETGSEQMLIMKDLCNDAMCYGHALVETTGWYNSYFGNSHFLWESTKFARQDLFSIDTADEEGPGDMQTYRAILVNGFANEQ